MTSTPGERIIIYNWDQPQVEVGSIIELTVNGMAT